MRFEVGDAARFVGLRLEGRDGGHPVEGPATVRPARRWGATVAVLACLLLSAAATAVTRTVAAGNQLKSNINTLFGLDDPTTATGSVSGVVKIESDQGLVGCVTFGDPVSGKILSSLPLMSTASAEREIYLDHLAMGNISGLDFYTGLALFNPSKERTANVTMYYKDPADNTYKQHAQTTKAIASQNRWVDLVNNLDASFNVTQNGGFLKITSYVEIFAFQLFGDYAFDYLSAVPVR